MSARRASDDDVPRLTRTLAEAFADDPVWTWMLPAPRRDERLRLIFGATLRHAVQLGHVYTVDDGRLSLSGRRRTSGNSPLPR